MDERLCPILALAMYYAVLLDGVDSNGATCQGLKNGHLFMARGSETGETFFQPKYDFIRCRLEELTGTATKH